MNSIFCLVFAAPAKCRVELRAKIGHHRNICFINVTCLHFLVAPKLHKSPYKSIFISNLSHCSTTILSKHIASALTAVKDHVTKYSETSFSNNNFFCSMKNSSYVNGKLRLRNFVSSFDFLLYTPHFYKISSKQICCLLLIDFSTESKTYFCTTDNAWIISQQKTTRTKVEFLLVFCEAFAVLVKMYMSNLMAWYINK